MAAVARKLGIFHQKKSLANREHLQSSSMRYIVSEVSRGCVPAVRISALKYFISRTLRRSLRWDLILEDEPRCPINYGRNINQVHYNEVYENYALARLSSLIVISISFFCDFFAYEHIMSPGCFFFVDPYSSPNIVFVYRIVFFYL